MPPQQHADDIDWDAYMQGPPASGVHWHGFLWKGEAARIFSFKHQAERTAGTPDFAGSNTPPEMTTHHLLKPHLVKATFTNPTEAAAWMRQQWEADPPLETYKNPDSCQKFSRRMAELGKDVVWSWDWPRLGDNTTVRVYMITCPSESDPGIRCPAPPRR
jgi:hypothetical protein